MVTKLSKRHGDLTVTIFNLCERIFFDGKKLDANFCLIQSRKFNVNIQADGYFLL